MTYLAEDTNLKRQVAIKEFLPSDMVGREADGRVEPLSADDAEFFSWCFERFVLEAQTLAKFSHPNIVHVLSVFRSNGTAYMVMDFVQGKTLYDALKPKRTGSERQILAIAMQLVDGLERVHEEGFIHRDIKPANILMRRDGSPLLLDFGSARHAIGAQTRALTAMVSPGYAPIEQYGATGEGEDKQGPWTDIYGLGATLYRATTGNAPIDATVRVNGLLSGTSVMEPAVSAARGRYSEALLEAIDAAMEIRPMDRPQTVADWRYLLRTGGGGRATTSTTALTAPFTARTGATTVPPPPTMVVTKVMREAKFAPTDELQQQMLRELEEWKDEHDRETEETKREQERREGRLRNLRAMDEVREEAAYRQLLDELAGEKGTGVVRLVSDVRGGQLWERHKLTEAVQTVTDHELLALLASGADPTIPDAGGTTPLEYARRAGRTRLTQLLTVAVRVWKKQQGRWRDRQPADGEGPS